MLWQAQAERLRSKLGCPKARIPMGPEPKSWRPEASSGQPQVDPAMLLSLGVAVHLWCWSSGLGPPFGELFRILGPYQVTGGYLDAKASGCDSESLGTEVWSWMVWRHGQRQSVRKLAACALRSAAG